MRRFEHRFERRAKLVRARELRAHPTPAETIAWRLLPRGQYNGWKFRRQHVVGGFIVDLYCPSLKLVIELDGAVHDHPAQLSCDLNRDAALSALGIEVVRIRNEDLSEHWLAEVLEPYAARPPSPRRGEGARGRG